MTPFVLHTLLGRAKPFRHVANQVTYYCVTDEKIQNGQMIDIVKLYLRDHPETRQYSAPTLIMLAFKEKFPCKGDTNE